LETVALSGVSDPAQIRAIAAVAALWDFRVETRPEGDWDRVRGIVVGDGLWQRRLPALMAGRPFLAFAGNGAPPEPADVVFSSHASLPEIVRGRTLAATEAASGAPLESLSGIDAAASVNGRAIWRAATRPDGSSLIVGSPPPSIGEEERICQVLNSEIFLHALPLWVFFRGLAAAPRIAAPLRACLVVDDPNLRRLRYGYVDYGKLVEFARERPFHAAIATIPLDGWCVSRAAARLFRENQGCLSLAVHGNDHLHYELARPRSPADRLALAAQSLERIAAMEQRAGISVDRVMVPPHGVCSPEMMESLWRGGFEGMTTNRWSLWKHSPPSILPGDSGLRPADLLAGGLPVVNRFRFHSSLRRNEILFAALLGQPIVPYGHHKDFFQGMAEVRATVDAVNALGPVRWMSLRGILETNFEQLVENDTLRVRMFSRRVLGTMPDSATLLQAELPAHARHWGAAIEAVCTGEDGIPRQFPAALGQPVAVPPGCRFELRLVAEAAPPAMNGKAFKRRPSALLKRLASEACDRLLP
jgi:hypothetical protein